MKKVLFGLMLLSVLMFVAACTSTTISTPPANAPTTPAAPAAAPQTASGTSTAQASGAVYQVVIENYKFNPANLDVKVGDSVEWINKDGIDHTITLENGDFDQRLVAGSKVSYTFNQKDEFRYLCSIHPSMQGTVIVS